MNRKSQIALFIILGLTIMIGVGFVLYLKNSSIKKPEVEQVSKLPFDTDSIQTYIEACIEDVGKDAISFIGRHGGYFALPQYSTKDYFTKTAYYFYIDKDFMPSKSIIERELSKYMDEELFFCMKNFAQFEEMGFDIGQGIVETTAVIQPNNVLFRVDFPLSVKKLESEIKLNYFSSSVDNIRLGVIYNVSRAIINEQMEDLDSICLSCIINHAIENDLYVDLQRLDDDIVTFTVTDFNSKIEDFPYKYIFANKYREISCTSIPFDWPEEKINDFLLNCAEQKIEGFNYTLRIDTISDLNAVVDMPFVYDVNALGTNLNFSDFSDLFDINAKTGLINFIPNENDIGQHTIWIHVVDSLGNEDFEAFQLNITKP